MDFNVEPPRVLGPECALLGGFHHYGGHYDSQDYFTMKNYSHRRKLNKLRKELETQEKNQKSGE